jgi:tetratricopeptide (TPR) repeat protein
MPCRLAGLVLVFGLAAVPRAATGQTAALDPEIGKGVALVEEGDYDGAILTLDSAARRLAANPAKARDLSQAYLYLGIAYLGKGHEAAAKANFREALGRIKDLTLSPEKFPPKVIDLFEAAREETIQTRATTPSPGTRVQPTPEPNKRGSSKALLIGAGIAAAAGVGVAVAVAGGGGGGGGSSTPSVTTPPADTRIVETFTGSLCGDFNICEQYHQYGVQVNATGALEATVTWTEPRAQYTMELHDNADRPVAASNRLSDTSAGLQGPVTPQLYWLYIDRQDDIMGPVPFTLTVRHP